MVTNFLENLQLISSEINSRFWQPIKCLFIREQLVHVLRMYLAEKVRVFGDN